MPLEFDDLAWIEPPASPTGEPWIWVDIRFAVHKLTKIDTVEGSAFIKVSQFSYWTDPRLQGWKGELPDNLWGPRLNLQNSLGDLDCRQDEFSLTDRSTGRVRRAYVYEGCIDNDMNLRDFPFDLDSVPLIFTTMSRWTSNDQSRSGKVPYGKSYRLRKVCQPGEGNWLRLNLTNTIPEFELLGMSTMINELPPNVAGSERTRVSVTFHVSRKAGFYMYKVRTLSAP